MKLLCIEDVIMDDGRIAYIKDKQYLGYKTTIPKDYDVIPVLCAKDELPERQKHVIKRLKEPKNDFFDRNFQVI